jgi:hypothetical protein
MKAKKQKAGGVKDAASSSPYDVFEDIVTEKLEHITTFLCRPTAKKASYTMTSSRSWNGGSSKSPSIAITMSRASGGLLGINRNTFQKKLIKLGIENKVKP